MKRTKQRTNCLVFFIVLSQSDPAMDADTYVFAGCSNDLKPSSISFY
ncbi:hypothetical protein LACWKB10_1979 [Lactobacillus sp. wkB10]|nr:hypothetical protein LACWKB10_1979 [Lactobacillus sp. wkB10]